MLTTILYRSHLAEHVPVKTLPSLVSKASAFNAHHQVTGILLFNGTHFFQLLEGPREGVQAVYQRICADQKHHNLVELMRDYAPLRRFGNAGMELFDLRDYDKSEVLQAVLDKGTTRYQLTYNDRALQFLRTFVESREKENYYEVLPGEYWEFVAGPAAVRDAAPATHDAGHPPVLFQPIVDPLAREVNAVDGELAGVCLSANDAAQSPDATADLQRLQDILAAWSDRRDNKTLLNVSLAAHTLATVPAVASVIARQVREAGLVPEQVVISLDEKMLPADVSALMSGVIALKTAGISLCINNFGAGAAGLSLLTRIQPERLKIDASIIRDIHRSGPKQAVVQAIIRCCSAMEIVAVAAGITQAEEWMWLEAAGVINFQGELFAGFGPADAAHVAWPEYRDVI
ncbi:EAL domain-containing protein [Erwinia sp. E602]|uniref:diguanylate phosphodiesterase n=1 Tax=Erwinia sp. E602 TaxID=2675378 RepID=UPI001BA690FA|nr:diguanylate phosphodiesterase [Erwinia sp. E602]QUG75083.1 EAL domain-containing protein [Erwinia sp. E602]